MPARFSKSQVACALAVAGLLGASHSAWSQATQPTAKVAVVSKQSVENSALDANLFYQLLIAELEVGNSEPSSAALVLLDAAHKAQSEQLYKRATDVALQARAGDQALSCVQAWRKAFPASVDAHRYLIQLLVALNRSPEASEPLRSLIHITPAEERPLLIASLPRFFERTGNPKLTPGLLEKALQPYLEAADTRTVSQVALAHAWHAAGDTPRALELAERAHTQDPAAEGPVLMALQLLPTTAAAEPIILGHLQAQPKSHQMRLFYAQALTLSQRYADALKQVERVTRDAPAVATPWLTLGALRLEMRQPKEATAALKTFLERTDAAVNPAAQETTVESTTAPSAASAGPTAAQTEQNRTQALLLLAQAAEQQNDYKAAEAWLAKIDSPQRALDVQMRRASLMAKQGKLTEGLALIKAAPEASEDDARAKLLAQVQLLREARQWEPAHQLLVQANARSVDDPDLLYEQSMMAEKLNHIDEMERLLRQVITLRPDHHHAHNALGFSLADRGLRLPEAKSLIEHALSQAPGDPFITDSLGWVEYRLGNRDAAIKLLMQAYQARPDAEIAAHLGEVLWVNGQQDDARRVLREGTSRDNANDVLRETVVRLKVDL
jgi:tetratricopeptide (TPR) repeat protein